MSIERDILELQARVGLLETLAGGITSGTWTPVWEGTGTAGVYTYTNQIGVFTRVGNLVYINARLTISAIGTPPVGNMRIGGLPYACEATYNHPVAFGFISQFNYTAAALDLNGIVGAGIAYISLRETFDNAATVAAPAANFTNTACDMIFSATYRTA